MQTMRGVVSVGHLVALSIATLVFAGPRIRAPSRGPGQAPVAVAYACPGERKSGVRFIFDSAGTLDTVATIPLSEPITNIPEFHDCQNFILTDSTRDSLRYDSLYAIFAAFRLRDRFYAKRPPAETDSLKLPDGSVVPVVAAATIFSGSRENYSPLGIAPGFNCLFLYHRPANPTQWGARMVPLKVPDANCARTGIDLTGGTTLEVRVIRDTLFSAGDYPEAARWDWDSRNRQQYIGIMCENAWCEVGKANFVSSPPRPEYVPAFKVIPGLPPTPEELSRVTGIKGWYDRQMLATRGPNGLVPSGIYGVVIPNPALDRVPTWTVSFSSGRISIGTLYDKRWINVGAAVVTAPYKGLLAGVNLLYFCRGTAAACAVPLGAGLKTPAMWSAVTSCANGGPYTWWGRLGAGETAQYGCVHVQDHGRELKALTAPGAPYAGWVIALPATARWHWSMKDEIVGWYGCQSTSCCNSE